MEPSVWIIAGTSEGRRLISALKDAPFKIYVSVATDYGASLIEKQENVTVLAGRLDLAQMQKLLQQYRPFCVVDATHPYATVVTDTVKSACAAENGNYIRLLRPAALQGEYTMVKDFDEAVELLSNLDGNIFLTTGSKNLRDFTKVTDYRERTALRILPMRESLETALQLDYKPSNIVCMQGPFSIDLNVAMLKKFKARYMVTKDSGEAGGFSDKVEAAAAAGAKLIVVGRAKEESGEGFADVLNYLLGFCEENADA